MLEVKLAEMEDVPLLARLGRHFHDISTYGKFMSYSEKNIQNNFYRMLQEARAFLAVAWEDGKVAGSIGGVIVNGFYDHDELIAQCLYVATVPECQKKGAAKKLRQAFEKWAIDNGAAVIMYEGYSDKFLETMKKDGYEKVQYTVIKRVADAV